MKSSKINQKARTLKKQAARLMSKSLEYQRKAIDLQAEALEANSAANSLFAEGHYLEKEEIIGSVSRNK